ncbi:hypothetical protein F5Y10DRAFT_264322 [Nemania abortiva]|nr:hypothetical protein F5Y10DRAFT_264322 [Nemania abortiva]
MDTNETDNLMATRLPFLSQPLQQPHQFQLHSLLDQHQHQQQHQLSAAQQPTPPRQYTTVGSVYNPQSQPLQPPVRRGRTVKSLFPYKSESPAGPPQLQYTPLQQNSDRAVSPVRIDPNSLPSTLTVTPQERQILRKFGYMIPNIPQPTTMPGGLHSPIPNDDSTARYIDSRLASSIDSFADSIADDTTMLANAHANSDDGSDGADTKLISAMNINTLTNLASYPNSVQRAAQKLLASRRPRPGPATASHVSDSQPTLCHAGAEPLALLAEYQAYMPTNSKVPGAPAPLTAGPPGVRQLRPATFDQDVLQRPREFDDENPVINPYHTLPINHQLSGLSLQDESVSPAPTAGTMDDDADNYNNDHYVRIFDTLTADEARSFYPDGLPLNFNLHTQFDFYDWESERLKKVENPLGWYLNQNEDFWTQRSQFIRNHFYSGVNKYNKAFNVVLSEYKHRSVAQLVGRPYKEPPSNHGKVINHEIPVSDASLMPTSEQYGF